MEHRIYCDESGIGHESSVVGIGCLVVPTNLVFNFRNYFSKRIGSHGVVGELKWNKIGNSHGAVNMSLDIVHYCITHGIHLEVILAHKDLFRKWGSTSREREDALYMLWSYALKHALRDHQGEADVLIDQREDAYSKQDEVLQIITNRMAAKSDILSRISRLRKFDSRKSPGIQTIDVVTGALTGARDAYLREREIKNEGKRLLVDRFAKLVGWDKLIYDTMPNGVLNIWHFPQEARGIPKTREVNFSQVPNFVTAKDFASRAERLAKAAV